MGAASMLEKKVPVQSPTIIFERAYGIIARLEHPIWESVSLQTSV